MLPPILAQNTTLDSVFSGLPADEQFALMIVAIGCLTAVVITLAIIISSVLYKAHRHRCEDGLKREMLDRGMSADEIETVIKATPPSDFMERMADRNRRHKC